MQKYIAILRGINVSGKNKIRMKDLTMLLEKAGLQNVQTYIQSGNIVFDHDEKPEKYFEELIHKAIYNEFGYEIPVIVMKGDYLKKVVEHNPFAKRKEIDPKTLHITFLTGYPDEANVQAICETKSPPDELLPGDKAFFMCGARMDTPEPSSTTIFLKRKPKYPPPPATGKPAINYWICWVNAWFKSGLLQHKFLHLLRSYPGFPKSNQCPVF